MLHKLLSEVLFTQDVTAAFSHGLPQCSRARCLIPICAAESWQAIRPQGFGGCMSTIYHQDMDTGTQRSSEQLVWELGGALQQHVHNSETCPCWAPLDPRCSSAAGLQRKRGTIPHHTAMSCQSCLCLRPAPDNASQLIRELTAPEKKPWLLSSARENGDKAEFSRAEGRSQPCWLTSTPYFIFLIPLYSLLVSLCQPLPFLSELFFCSLTRAQTTAQQLSKIFIYSNILVLRQNR